MNAYRRLTGVRSIIMSNVIAVPLRIEVGVS